MGRRWVSRIIVTFYISIVVTFMFFLDASILNVVWAVGKWRCVLCGILCHNMCRRIKTCVWWFHSVLGVTHTHTQQMVIHFIWCRRRHVVLQWDDFRKIIRSHFGTINSTRFIHEDIHTMMMIFISYLGRFMVDYADPQRSKGLVEFICHSSVKHLWKPSFICKALMKPSEKLLPGKIGSQHQYIYIFLWGH